MMMFILMLVVVSASSNQFWNYRGCYPVSDLLLRAMFDIRNEVRGETFAMSWASCVKLMLKHSKTTIGIVNDGNCYGCKNCSIPTYKVRESCPDYGHKDRIQLFNLESNRDLIPDQYRECSKTASAYRCKDLHPLAYKDNDSIDPISSSETNVEKVKQLLPSVCSNSNECQDSTISRSSCMSVFQDYKTALNIPTSTIELDFSNVTKSYDPRIPVVKTAETIELRDNSAAHLIWNSSTLTQAIASEEFQALSSLMSQLNSLESFVNKTGVVLGSSKPWIESYLLRVGASHLITVEYKPILSLLPDITALTPLQLASRFLADNWSPVDFAFSFSSIEHSGLGRYGDPVDGEGDLRAMRQISCLLKPGGVLFLSVPVGPDALVYNEYRVYGRYRLPSLLEGWELLEVLGDVYDIEEVPFSYSRPVLVLRKPVL